MDVKRITSALLGFPLVVIIFLIGNKYIVDVLISIVAMLGMYEYFKAISKVCKPVKWVGYLSCLSIAFIHVIPSAWLNSVVTLSVPTILAILFLNIIATDMRINFKDIAYTFIGIFYIVFFMMFVAFINGMPNGNINVWYAIIAAWGTDVFAYFVGKHFGKHKFSKVSPNKTIEGCIAGTIGAILSCLIYTFILNKVLHVEVYSYLTIAIIAFVLSIIGQIGDFAASTIKRQFDVKDFSEIFPGHGGMIDRIDSVIFAAPYAYFIFIILL